MKTFVFDHNYNPSSEQEHTSWYFLADSALTNAGKPFFIPDFAADFEAIPTIAIKINRLGKSVSPQFGSRYYSEYAPAIHFRAKDLMGSLLGQHLPADRAYSFDRSFIMADFMPFPSSGEVALTMCCNGKATVSFNSSELSTPIDEAIAKASYANTLKMGDLIVPGLPIGESIAIGDLIELSSGGETLLTVQIK